jgi:RNA polymerase sigma factor (sigma-70 family)
MVAVSRQGWEEYVAFVERTAADVFRRFGGRFDRDDLRQTGMLTLVETLQTYDGRAETFGGYVRVRVRGAIFDAARSEYRRAFGRSARGVPRERVGREGPLASFDSAGGNLGAAVPVDTAWKGGRRSMESEILYRDFVRSLRQRLAALEGTERRAIQVCDLEQLSLERAGRRLGLSRSAVLRARRRALELLRDGWQAPGVAPTRLRRRQVLARAAARTTAGGPLPIA